MAASEKVMPRGKATYNAAMQESWGRRGLHRGWLVLLLIPSFIALVWTVYPAFNAWRATASYHIKPFTNDDVLMDDFRSQNRRAIQKHFRNNNLHLPIEDIIFVYKGAAPGSHEHRRALLMQKACGKGKLYVWVPIRFRIPFAGDLIYEWCWIPPIKRKA